MKKWPNKWTEKMKENYLYNKFLLFYSTIPKKIESPEDYKNFLDKISKLPIIIQELCNNARSKKDLKDFLFLVFNFFKPENINSREQLKLQVYLIVSDSLFYIIWENILEKNEQNDVKSALWQISNYWFLWEKNHEELTQLNNTLQTVLCYHQTREMPLSYLIELPYESENWEKIWVLFEKNLETWKILFSIFFWKKEPSEIKLDIVKKDNTQNNIQWPIFRDQVWVFSNAFWNDIVYSWYLSLLLWKDYEKLKAIILLWIAPILLRKEITEEIYKSYGIDFKLFEKRTSSGNWGDEKWIWNWVRNYPYNNTISDLFEDEDKKEINTRVTHKRLLPALKRPDWSYMSAKPSKRAVNIATEKWFTLGIWLWFPDKEKCIYPEKIDELLKNLEVTNINESLEKLLQMWENCVLRYETLVVSNMESQDDVKKTIKAKVWWIL